jgi:hypothetical protein
MVELAFGQLMQPTVGQVKLFRGNAFAERRGDVSCLRHAHHAERHRA